MLHMRMCPGLYQRAGRGLACLAFLFLLGSYGSGASLAQRPGEEVVHIDLGVIGYSTLATMFPSIVHRPIETISVRPGGDALGMGGAYLAVAEGASAVGWTPSGLAALDRSEIVFDGHVRRAGGSANGYPDSVTIPRFPPLVVTQYSMNGKGTVRAGFVGAATPLFKAGGISVVGALSWRRFGEVARPEEAVTDLAIGEERSFPIVFAVDIKESGVIESFAPTIAVRVIPGVSVGANLNFLTGQLRSSYAERLSFGGLPMTGGGEATFKYSGFVPDLGAGVSLMDGRARIAAKFTPAYTLKVSGGQFYNRSIATPGQPVYHVHGKVSGSDLEVPSAFSVGVAFRPSRRLLLAADYNSQMWSKASLTYKEPFAEHSLPLGMTPGDLPYKEARTLPLDDVSTMHMGAEYLLFQWGWAHVPVRLGYHQVPLGFRSAHENDFIILQLELPDGTPYVQPVHKGEFNGNPVEADAISFGASLRTGSFTYDLGIEFYSYEERKWFFDSVYDPVMNPRSRLVEHKRDVTQLRFSSTVHF